jgi:hypothetical protein
LALFNNFNFRGLLVTFKFAGMEFVRTKFSALLGLTTVTYKEVTDRADAFTMEATQKGINFSGRMTNEISTGPQLQGFAKAVSGIWEEHESLAPSISVTNGEIASIKNG